MQVQFSLLLALAGVTLGWPGLSIAASPETRSIQQHSEGACSPPIVNNEGHVSISCPGVTPEALRYLENELSDQFGRLNEQLRGLTIPSGRSEISTGSSTTCTSRPMTGHSVITICPHASPKAGTTAIRRSEPMT